MISPFVLKCKPFQPYLYHIEFLEKSQYFMCGVSQYFSGLFKKKTDKNEEKIIIC